jgi:hypothetical protein
VRLPAGRRRQRARRRPSPALAGAAGSTPAFACAGGGSRIPLLLITRETAPDRLQRVRESGVPVLFKPVDTDELLQVIGMTLGAAEAEVS